MPRQFAFRGDRLAFSNGIITLDDRTVIGSPLPADLVNAKSLDQIGIGWRKKNFGWALVVSDDGTITRIPPGQGEDTGHGDRFDALVQRLARRNVAARVSGDVRPFRVRTGSYSTRAGANAALAELRTRGIHGFVVDEAAASTP